MSRTFRSNFQRDERERRETSDARHDLGVGIPVPAPVCRHGDAFMQTNVAVIVLMWARHDASRSHRDSSDYCVFIHGSVDLYRLQKHKSARRRVRYGGANARDIIIP